MALESLWAKLNAEVTRVTWVQAPVYEGLHETPAILRGVSGVSSNDGFIQVATVINRAGTSDTPSENVGCQPQPAWTLGCTLDTPATPEKIANGHKKPWQFFRPHEPLLTDSEQSAARAYHLHHFSCRTCIAAGRGIRYGERCDVGLGLWKNYSRDESKSTIE
jgi:hypothetical protein